MLGGRKCLGKFLTHLLNSALAAGLELGQATDELGYGPVQSGVGIYR